MSLFDHKISELHEFLHNKEVKVSELVNEAYQKISETDDKVKAFLTLDEERARKTAAELDGKIGSPEAENVLFGMRSESRTILSRKICGQPVPAKSLKTSIPFMMPRLWKNYIRKRRSQSAN